MEIFSHIEKKVTSWFLLGISFVFFLLRLPSLFEPYWYGDEGIYQAMADALHSGRLLYSQVWDNKPPLLYTLYALFQGDQFSLRLVSLLVGLASISLFFLLSYKLMRNNTASIVSTSFFAILFAIPTFEGNIANAENFIVLPILLALLFLVYRFEVFVKHPRETARKLFLPGMMLGIAFLFKIVAVFDAFTFFFLLLIVLSSNNETTKSFISLVRIFVQTAWYGALGFITPFLLTCVYFFFRGSFADFFRASFLGNVGYVGYNNAFIIPQGFLIFKLILLAGALGTLYVMRHKLPFGILFSLSWLSLSLFNLFFSQRPYPHYLLVLLPSFCLLICAIFAYPKYRRWLGILFLGLIVVVNANFHISSYRSPLYYYQNFLSFVSGKKSVADYRTFFDRNVNKNYAIAEYLKLHTKPGDIVYLWGNSAQIYHLSQTLPPGKYVVGYHVAYNKLATAETEIDIEKTRPRYIVLQPDIPYYPFTLIGYVYRETIIDTNIYEKIY